MWMSGAAADITIANGSRNPPRAPFSYIYAPFSWNCGQRICACPRVAGGARPGAERRYRGAAAAGDIDLRMQLHRLRVARGAGAGAQARTPPAG